MAKRVVNPWWGLKLQCTFQVLHGCPWRVVRCVWVKIAVKGSHRPRSSKLGTCMYVHSCCARRTDCSIQPTKLSCSAQGSQIRWQMLLMTKLELNTTLQLVKQLLISLLFIRMSIAVEQAVLQHWNANRERQEHNQPWVFSYTNVELQSRYKVYTMNDLRRIKSSEGFKTAVKNAEPQGTYTINPASIALSQEKETLWQHQQRRVIL